MPIRWALSGRGPTGCRCGCYGPAAPHVRNGAIVAAASVVLVVWDGKSRGTLSAARAAAALGRRCEWLAAPAPSAVPVPGGLGL